LEIPIGSDADAVTVTVPLTVLPLEGELTEAVGMVVSTACVTVKVWPATVIVPVRELAVVFIATE
jgi:hypothetical protein